MLLRPLHRLSKRSTGLRLTELIKEEDAMPPEMCSDDQEIQHLITDQM